jgi:hypothetical protein
MKITSTITLQALTAAARMARGTAHAGLRLMDHAETLERTIDRLTARAGHTAEAVYAPLFRAKAR